MKNSKRWILVSPKGQPVRSFNSQLETGSLVYLPESNQLTLVDSLGLQDSTHSSQKIRVMGAFSEQKDLLLENGFKLRLARSDEAVIENSRPLADKEEQKKPLIGYFKKSGVIHVATVLSLILAHWLIQKYAKEETITELPNVRLVEIKKIKPPLMVTRKMSPKSITKPSTAKSEKIAPKTQFALLQGLSKVAKQQSQSKSAIQNAGAAGTVGGGTPSYTGAVGQRAANSGGGSLRSNSASGYGNGVGGANLNSGLVFTSTQRGNSLPSGPNDDFANSGLDRDQIIAVINKNRGQITYCYEQALKQDPSLNGKVGIQFVISPNGLVAKALVAESSANNNQLESCMISKLRTWQFPKPVGDVNVDVFYPFHLTKLGRR